jgi:hypothetical protein
MAYLEYTNRSGLVVHIIANAIVPDAQAPHASEVALQGFGALPPRVVGQGLHVREQPIQDLAGELPGVALR